MATFSPFPVCFLLTFASRQGRHEIFFSSLDFLLGDLPAADVACEPAGWLPARPGPASSSSSSSSSSSISSSSSSTSPSSSPNASSTLSFLSMEAGGDTEGGASSCCCCCLILFTGLGASAFSALTWDALFRCPSAAAVPTASIDFDDIVVLLWREQMQGQFLILLLRRLLLFLVLTLSFDCLPFWSP